MYRFQSAAGRPRRTTTKRGAEPPPPSSDNERDDDAADAFPAVGVPAGTRQRHRFRPSLDGGWSVTDGRAVAAATADDGNDGGRLLLRNSENGAGTPEELEMIATSTGGSGRRRSLVLVPAQGGLVDGLADEQQDEETSSESSMSSEDLDGSSPLEGTDEDDERDDGGGGVLLEDEEEEDIEDNNGLGREIILMDAALGADDDGGAGGGGVADDEETDDEVDDVRKKKSKRRSSRIFRFVGGGSSLRPRQRQKQRHQHHQQHHHHRHHQRRQLLKEVDVEQYMAKREMTKTQELWNAYTMIPSPLYCLYFMLAGLWVSPDLVLEAADNLRRQSVFERMSIASGGFTGLANDVVGDANGCLNNNDTAWSAFLYRYTSMPALPPLPVVAVAVGIVSHAPFSFLYHYKYAHALPAGLARTTHWSRRMDHTMIHFASALMSYGTSGSLDFFVANLLYNGDCMYRQFKRKVHPRRNKIRILISVLAYTIPILRRGDLLLFIKCWIVMSVSGWLFGSYPLGGWSHATFHLTIALLPPLLMTAACSLPASQEQMRVAAYCVASDPASAASFVIR